MGLGEVGGCGCGGLGAFSSVVDEFVVSVKMAGILCGDYGGLG